MASRTIRDRMKGLVVAAAISVVALQCKSSTSPSQVMVADLSVPMTAAIVPALDKQTFSLPSGGSFSSTLAAQATTLTFSAAAGAAPSAVLAAPGVTGTDGHPAQFTADVTFGSCDFTIRTSTFPAGSPLAVGQVIVINPCTLAVKTAGGAASGQSSTRSVTLTLGGITSDGTSVPVTINSNGTVQIFGVVVGTGTLTNKTGGG